MNQICRLLGISKKTYYYSIDPAQTLEQRYGRLKSMLERIIQKNPSYGYRRIKKALFEVYGEAVNHKVLCQWPVAEGKFFCDGWCGFARQLFYLSSLKPHKTTIMLISKPKIAYT